MPYIQSKVNVHVSKEKEIELKEKLGKAIETIPGKTEKWLMVGMEDNCTLYFRGSDAEKIAFIEVKIFGKASKEVFNSLTEKICDIYQEILGISQDHIYVKYEEISNWGWNGGNF